MMFNNDKKNSKKYLINYLLNDVAFSAEVSSRQWRYTV